MVERSHLTPFLYYILLDVDPKNGEPFMRWLSSKHIQEVANNPGFLWARRVPLDEPAEDGWKRLMIVYGINSREEYQAYNGGEAFLQYKEECKQFDGMYRVQRFFGQVDLVLE